MLVGLACGGIARIALAPPAANGRARVTMRVPACLDQGLGLRAVGIKVGLGLGLGTGLG